MSVESRLQHPDAPPTGHHGTFGVSEYNMLEDHFRSPAVTNEPGTGQDTGSANGAYNVETASSTSFSRAQQRGAIVQSILDEASSPDPFSYAVTAELCCLWFQKYHRWFPILHQPSFLPLLETATSESDSDYKLVSQAIVAVTVQHSQLLPADRTGRKQWQYNLSNEVATACMNKPCLQAIQALLILSTWHYGEGRLMQSWSLLAISRRCVSS